MKTPKALISSIVVGVLATCGFAQGKGGGASHGAGHGASSAPSAAGRASSTDTPARPAPHEQKPLTATGRSAAPAAQAYTAKLHDINQTAFSDRRRMLDTVDMSVKSNRDAMKQIQKTAKDSRVDARADFKAALNDVKAREKELDAALKDVRKADEAGWNARRDALAKAYQNHADAMARLETIARTP